MFFVILEGEVRSSLGSFSNSKDVLCAGDSFDKNGWIRADSTAPSSTPPPNSQSADGKFRLNTTIDLIANSPTLNLLAFNYGKFEKVLGKLAHLFNKTAKQRLLSGLDFVNKLPSEKVSLCPSTPSISSLFSLHLFFFCGTFESYQQYIYISLMNTKNRDSLPWNRS
jgi:hypothetical protein